MKVERVNNNIGVKLTAENGDDNVQVLMAYPEAGSVFFWVHLGPRYKAKIDELIQYLTPTEAMALAKGLERCAIAALKEGA